MYAYLRKVYGENKRVQRWKAGKYAKVLVSNTWQAACDEQVNASK
jgi:hypothetical protein